MDEYKDIIDKDKPVLHHCPMDVGHRAKQFAPFAALTGFEGAVREAEGKYGESIRPEKEMIYIP